MSTRSRNGCAAVGLSSTSTSPALFAVGARAPRTMSAPAMPLATWSAVEPCRCEWYQKVPAGCSGGILYSYWKLTPGLIEISTLSPLPAGLTHRPCACRLVPLKQCGVLAGCCPEQLASCGRSFFSEMRTVSPGAASMVGDTYGAFGSTPVP